MLKMFNKSRKLNEVPRQRTRKLCGSELKHEVLILNPIYLVDIVKSLDKDLNKEAERVNYGFNVNAYPSMVVVEDEGRMQVEDFIRSKYTPVEQLYGKTLIIETHKVFHNHSKKYNFLMKVDGAQLRVSDLGDMVVFETLPVDHAAISFVPAIKNLLKYQLRT